MLSGAARAQMTFLAADGTQTSNNVPIYGYWADYYLRCQTIYPSTMMEEIAGRQILGLKWFLSSTSSEQLSSNFQVRIGEATQASFSGTSFLSNNDFMLVYSGTINTTVSSVEIEFSEAYTYTGGNLVIEVISTTSGNYSSCSFYGVSSNNASLSGYNSSSWSSVTGSTSSFIPKTEFSITEGDVSCPMPTMDVPTVDGTTVTINWTENGDARDHAVYLNNVLQEIVSNQTSYTFTNLQHITTYSAKVRAICSAGDTSFAASRSFTTPCGSVSLPYNEGFENFTSGYGNFPDCWTSVDGTNYTQSGYAATGSQSLHLAGGTVITPPLVTNGQPIEVVFSAKCESTSISGTIQVGFTNNPDNLNSVQWAAAIQPEDTEHHTYEASFESTGTTTTGYLVFRQNTSNSSYYYWLDDIYVGVMSDCRRVEDMTVHSVARTGAAIGWTAPASGAPDSYFFEYRADGAGNWISETLREPYIILSGLSMNTTYEARVRSMCGGDLSRDRSITFSTLGCDVRSEQGSSTSSYVPFNGYYSYGYSQSLYPASELEQLDTILGIAFYCTSTNNSAHTIDIYLGNTTATSVTTNSYVPLSALTRVAYNRSITFAVGWNEINFTTPFVYDGNSNLVVAVDNNTGSYYSSISYRHHASAGSSSCYWYQDGSDYDPASPSGGSTNNLQTVPDVKFLVSCTDDGCQSPLVVPVVTGSHSVDLHWQPVSHETSWRVEYKILSDSEWIVAAENLTTTDYSLTDLAAGLDYQFRVTANCTGDEASSTVQAFTQCDLFEVPYTESFDAGSINPCWATSPVSNGYPGVVGRTLYTGSSSVWVILPEFTQSVTSLMMTFKAKSTDDQGTVSVGVTVGQDIASFTEVESFDYEEDYTDIEVYFDNYTGTGNNIAIKFETGKTQADDIEVSVAPKCRRPTNIRVEEVGATTAVITWQMGPNATGATVRYRRVGGRWTQIDVDGNTATLVDLVANSDHEVIVRARCADEGNSESSNTFVFHTACADGSMIVTEGYPFIENFENGIQCWQQEYVSGELDWVTQRGDGETNQLAHGIDTAYEGNLNAVLFNFLNYTVGLKTRLVSPLLNTESLDSVFLKYAYGLTTYTDQEHNTQSHDELEVSYRLNANSPWIRVNNHTMATTGWVRDSVQLPQGSATLQVAFTGYFNGGNGVAVDDVRVYKLGHDTRIDDEPAYSAIDDLDDVPSYHINIYPNPASHSTTVVIDGIEGMVQVSLFDMSGRVVRTESLHCDSGCRHSVNLDGLAQGAYFVRVASGQQNTVRKLIVR